MTTEKNLTVLILLTSLLTLSSCNIFKKEVYDISKVEMAMEYNDNLIYEEIKVIDQINRLDDEFATYDPIAIEAALNDTKEQIKLSMKKVKKAKAFYGDKSLKESLRDLFDMFERQLNDQYTEMLQIYRLSEAEYTKKEENRYNTLLDEMDAEYEKVFKKFADTQIKFAEKYGFELE